MNGSVWTGSQSVSIGGTVSQGFNGTVNRGIAIGWDASADPHALLVHELGYPVCGFFGCITPDQSPIGPLALGSGIMGGGVGAYTHRLRININGINYTIPLSL
jgi:hypothetical protein